MKKLSGARNTSGFSASISAGALSSQNHITYEGIFNELKFDVGKKTEKITDLHFGYARYQFSKSQQDNSINDYLALFVKGSSDGEERDQRPLNAIICLDTSGSMSGGLGDNGKQQRSRLNLSVEAIKMFISKLRPNDSVGLVTFTNSAQVIFKPILKKDISQQVFLDLDKIIAAGGTTIRTGFAQSKKLLQTWLQSNESPKCSENRIIMLTDVCDNSIEGQKVFIEEISTANINVTIIGISTGFRSQVCENLKHVKGFNYFCAVSQQDIKKYVFQTFDFGFFPSAYDLNIKMISDDIQSFQVFGAPDSDQVNTYNNHFVSPTNEFIVTKVKSTFPSQIEIENEKIYTVGGLVLLKLKRKGKQPFFKGQIVLNYRDPFNNQYQQIYELSYQFHPSQQFFSEQALIQALQGFIFTHEIKQLLRQSYGTKGKSYIYEKYWPILLDLELIAPKSKLNDLENVKKIVNSFKPKQI